MRAEGLAASLGYSDRGLKRSFRMTCMRYRNAKPCAATYCPRSTSSRPSRPRRATWASRRPPRNCSWH